jgi:hypothetical protein
MRALVAEALGSARMRRAEERGTAMTLDSAAELAVLLIQRDPESAAPAAARFERWRRSS